MNPNPCVSIQEEIAWGKPLSPELQMHVLSCPSCTKISLEFSKLDSAFSNSDVQIPENFTDRVMQRVHNENPHFRRTEWLFRLGGRIGNFFQLRPVQVTLALWIAFSMSRAF